jgi:ABC-type transporter Mla subunit MlaD
MTYLTTMSDRKLGYAILFFFLFVIIAGIGFALHAVFIPGETRVIAFSEIGSLRLEDAVRVRGITLGTIKKIERTHKKVIVSTQYGRPLKIHRGYSVITVDQGVMGDRILQIGCGDTAAPLISPQDTLEGTFYPGVSEAVGYAWLLREVVDTLVLYSEQLLHGTSARKSLVAQVKGIITVADSLSKVFLFATRDFDASLSPQIDSIDALVNKTTLFSNSVAATTPEYIDNISSTIGTLSKLVTTLDTTASALRAMASGLQKPGNILLGNDAENIRKKLVELQEIVHTVQVRMLQFKIYIGLF